MPTVVYVHISCNASGSDSLLTGGVDLQFFLLTDRLIQSVDLHVSLWLVILFQVYHSDIVLHVLSGYC